MAQKQIVGRSILMDISNVTILAPEQSIRIQTELKAKSDMETEWL